MVFTQREKAILIATIAAVCLLVADFYVLTPFLEGRAAVQIERDQLLGRMARAGSVLKRRRVLGPKWRGMLKDGLRQDLTEAESQLLWFLRNQADQAGVKLSSLRPDRSAEESPLPEVTVHVAGTGSMAGVMRLLWGIETARLPAKVKMLQLGSRKEGTDDLSMQLRVSTLYCPPVASANGEAAPDKGLQGGEQ